MKSEPRVEEGIHRILIFRCDSDLGDADKVAW
jgi:hypothetical protein